MSARTASILLVGAALLAPSALGLAPSGEIDGPGWLLFEFVGGESSGWLRAAAELHGPGVVSAELRYVMPGHEHYSGHGATFWTPGIYDRAGGPDIAAGPLHAHADGRPYTAGATTTIPAGVSGFALLWSQSASDSWEWNATLPPGASLTLVGTGKGGYFWTGADARDGAHAHLTGLGGSASVSINASYRFEVQHLLVGFAGMTIPESQLLRDRVNLTLPDRTLQTCPCKPSALKEWRAGEYELGWTGIGVGSPTILLAGVDAPGFPAFDWPS